MSLSVSMSGLGRWAEGWGRWRELPAGGIRASQGTFSSFLEFFQKSEILKNAVSGKW